jgi:hypothetical protein
MDGKPARRIDLCVRAVDVQLLAGNDKRRHAFAPALETVDMVKSRKKLLIESIVVYQYYGETTMILNVPGFATRRPFAPAFTASKSAVGK